MRYEAFVAVTEQAVEAFVVQGAPVDWQHRELTPDVVRTDKADDLRLLVEALHYAEPSGDVALMEWPALTFGFTGAGQRVLAEVSYVRPGWLRHPTWPGDQRLSGLHRIEEWLASHGWPPAV